MPLIYGVFYYNARNLYAQAATTDKFLTVFGLSSLADLPNPETADIDDYPAEETEPSLAELERNGQQTLLLE